MHYRIHFEDHGQDFIVWKVSEDGRILDAIPFQAWLWTQYRVLTTLVSLAPGNRLVIQAHEQPPQTLIYPVAKVERIESEVAA